MLMLYSFTSYHTSYYYKTDFITNKAFKLQTKDYAF